MIGYKERVFWNMQGYGKVIKIRRSYLIAAFVIICLITPATNWMIPFAGKIIKSDISLRFLSDLFGRF